MDLFTEKSPGLGVSVCPASLPPPPPLLKGKSGIQWKMAGSEGLGVCGFIDNNNLYHICPFLNGFSYFVKLC